MVVQLFEPFYQYICGNLYLPTEAPGLDFASSAEAGLVLLVLDMTTSPKVSQMKEI